MKKIWYTVAVALTAATLTACGGESGSGETQSSTAATQAQQTTQAQSESQTQEQSGSWVTKDVDTSGFAAPQISTVDVANSVKTQIVKTPFDFNVDEVKSKVEKNQFVADKYVLALSKGDSTSSAVYDGMGDMYKYRVVDSVGGVAKAKAVSGNKYYNDFTITFTRDTNKYSNYNRIYIRFSEMAPEENLQEKVYGAISEALGKEYAELLVYAKDADGTVHGSAPENEVALGDYIDIAGGSYLFNRTYFESNGKISLTFELELTKVEGVKDFFDYYDGGYTSVVEAIPYGIGDVINGDVGNTDYKKCATLFDKYMKPGVAGYVRTFLKGMDVEYTVADNGSKVTTYKADLERSKTGDSVPGESQKFEYAVVEDAAGICSIELKVAGDLGTIDGSGDKSTAYNQLFEVGKKRVNCLFPEIDLSKESYDTMTDLYLSKDVTVVVNGLELKGTVYFKMVAPGDIFNIYAGSYCLELSYTK